MKHLYTLRHGAPQERALPATVWPDPQQTAQMQLRDRDPQPEPFYDPSTIYRDGDENEPNDCIPDWIAFTVAGAGIAFVGVVCWACWLVLHHRGGH